MTDSLAEQIESAWDSLTDQRKTRTYYLTDDGRLRYGDGAHEVGTFDSRVSLADFRESVFFVYEQTRRARHG